MAHDLHPEYLSTKHAVERDGVRLVGVQHHHAHLAACLAEHGELHPAVGAIFDGTGYGEDGTVWGGELLFGDLAGYERAGLLFPVRMPGGEAAVRQPWRMACAWLAVAFDEPRRPPPQLARQVDQHLWDQVSQLAVSGLSSPLTTSAGRLFDAVAGLCGLRSEVNYEGQAAVELEAACDLGEPRAYDLPLLDDGGPLVIDARPMIRDVVGDLEARVEIGRVAARFHNALAETTALACTLAAERRRTDLVVLSGGVFQNRRLLGQTATLLADAGLRVLTPERLPPNDGGIAYGQLAVAGASLAAEGEGADARA